MSTPQLVLWIAALAVGVSSAWKNTTACALLIAFMASEAGLPVEYYVYSDAFVIAAVMVKFQCSPGDRLIMLGYPIAWYFYVMDAPGSYEQWWHLWDVAVFQFLVVGLEPLFPYIRRRYAEALVSQPPQGLMLAYPGVRGGG